MSGAKEAIERGLSLFSDLVGESPPLEEEFERSRLEFGPPGRDATPEEVIATRRHLEWFLFERPSEVLGGVPAEALQESWQRRAGPLERDLVEAFLHSQAGAFEVTSSIDGRGLWVRDLFGLGEYPIEEAEAAGALLQGDLLVGRIFPVGEGVFRLSPAVGCFRDPRLLEAVRDDLERLRESRRGVLRIQQLELERLFYGSNGSDGSIGAREPGTTARLSELRGRVRSELIEAGLEPEAAEDLLRAIRDSAPSNADVVPELLDRIAFETDADLDRARRALVELWGAERPLPPDALVPAPRESTAAARSPEVSSMDAQAALDAFDQGRAEGRDLEQLFDELASDLGVGTLEDEEDGAAPPDFPGVVGAMVEEFLWDVGRESGAPAAERFAPLRLLSRYAEGIGVFENLGARDLVDFGARWLLDVAQLSGPEEARAVLDAVEAFCHWCEERHAHALWADYEAAHRALFASVPRLVAARGHLSGSLEGSLAGEVTRVTGSAIDWIDPAGGEHRTSIVPGLRELVARGDVALVSQDGRGELTALYPAQLRDLASSLADADSLEADGG